MNLATLLTRSAAQYADLPALRLGSETFDYATLDDASARLAGLLTSRGVAPGDRVAIMLPNVPHFAVLFYGILRAGGVVVPMNPLFKAREVAYYLEDSGAKLIFAWPTAAEQAEAGAAAAGVEAITVAEQGFLALLADHRPQADLVERDDQDTAVILYTSGTTGRPKGAELTHANLMSNVEVTQQDLLRLAPGDVVFGGLPLFHVFGLTCTLNTTIGYGGSLVLLPRFDPAAAADLLVAHRANVFAGVPTMFNALLSVPGEVDLPDLRLCVSGGAALPVEVLNRFESRFGAVILEGYGLSETSPVASFNTSDARRAGSIGTPVTGVQMRVIDTEGNEVPAGEVGEIAIRGHNVMKGYWHKPEATAQVLDADGWFRSGDLGRVDADGFFFIVDRTKDMIIRGGYNVYPREIEEVLYEHPSIVEAAVIGLPHAHHGEEIGACVVLAPGATVTGDEIRDFVKAQVAAYKYPRVVWFVDALPKGATGKILKREITPPAGAVSP